MGGGAHPISAYRRHEGAISPKSIRASHGAMPQVVQGNLLHLPKTTPRKHDIIIDEVRRRPQCGFALYAFNIAVDIGRDFTHAGVG